jgi:hypothetical protein
LALSGVAVADVVVNSLDNTIDNTKEQMSLTVDGSAQSTLIRVEATKDKIADESSVVCNVSETAKLVVNIESDKPDVATVSPSTLTFSACGVSQPVTVTPGKAGTTNIDFTKASTSTADGAFDLFTARFQAVVSTPAGSANTKPSVVVSGAADGASYEIGSEPTPVCIVTDTEDGTTTHPAVVTGTLDHGLGQRTATCDYTDQGSPALAADTKSVTYTIVDTGKPTITGSFSPAANAAGWHNGDVAVSFTCADTDGSGIQSCLGATTLSGDGANQSVTGTATDWAGNQETATVSGVNIDTTAPVITDDSANNAVTGTAGSNGWYTSDVTVTFRASDNLSGFAGATNPHTFTRTSSGDGAAVTVGSGTVDDLAGNTSNSVTRAFKIDTVAPDVPTLVGGPAAGSSTYFGSVPTAPTCTSDDATSGLAGCVVSGYSTAVGSHTMTATATDNAGNTSTVTRSYTVLAWTLTGFYSPVDMGGVLNIVKAGSTVPLKFEMFAGSTELTSLSDIKSFTTAKVNCGALTGAVTDEIEVVSTGGTSLRYDTTGGQFIQNWKTPTGSGVCYKATMTAQDGSSLAAFFKTK